MSLFSRRIFLTALLGLGATLGACGFTPIYGPRGSAEDLQGSVSVSAPDNREAYEFVKRLEERLGQSSNARFSLTYGITTRIEGAGVTATHEITRSQIFGTATFTLIQTASGAQVQSGSVTSFTSFSNLGTTVSTATVERDAYRRLMVALADLLTTRLIATAPDWLE